MATQASESLDKMDPRQDTMLRTVWQLGRQLSGHQTWESEGTDTERSCRHAETCRDMQRHAETCRDMQRHADKSIKPISERSERRWGKLCGKVVPRTRHSMALLICSSVIYRGVDSRFWRWSKLKTMQLSVSASPSKACSTKRLAGQHLGRK